MCCLLTTLMFVGPRLGILVWYAMTPLYVNSAFDHFIWGFLGWMFLPWTTLMYISVYPGGVTGFDWIIIGLGIFTDFAGFLGGYRERERVPYGEYIP